MTDPIEAPIEAKPDEHEQHDRGRRATKPAELGWRGWRDVAWRVGESMGQHRVGLISAGVGFFAFLAIFPAIAAAIAIAAMFVPPESALTELRDATRFFPDAVAQVIVSQLADIAHSAPESLSIRALLGTLLAVWSAKKGTAALLMSINIAYRQEDRSNLFRREFIYYTVTLGMVICGLVALFFLAVLPVIGAVVGLPPGIVAITGITRWVVLSVGMIGFTAMLYRWAPVRRRAQWRWIGPGSYVATVLWVAVSRTFDLYVTRLSNFNETYGTIAAVVALMLWFWISAMCIVLGAVVNAELEHQTCEDTTVGPGQPMGSRGAYVADNIGPVPQLDRLPRWLAWLR